MATGVIMSSGPAATSSAEVAGAVVAGVVAVGEELFEAVLVLVWLVLEGAKPTSSATLPKVPVLPVEVEVLLVWPFDDSLLVSVVFWVSFLAVSVVVVFGLRQNISHKTNQVTPAAMQRYTIAQRNRPAFEGFSCSYIVAALLTFSSSLPQLLT